MTPRPRGTAVYGERTGVVDEPTQPAPSLGDVTYARMAELARAQAAKLESLGLGVGDRVAYVSHNSARLLTAFYGVCGWGRVLVPVNFRLSVDEVRYIVGHSGARVVYVDPELKDALADVEAEHVFVIGEDDDMSSSTPSRRRGSPTRTRRRPSTTRAARRPPQGRADHAPQHLDQRDDVRAARGGHRPRRLPAHAADVSRQRLGDALGMTGCGVPHIVLRKVDGAEILRRVQRHGVPSCARPPPSSPRSSRPRRPGTARSPAATAVRIIVAGAPPPTRTVARGARGARLGVHPDLRASPRPRRC